MKARLILICFLPLLALAAVIAFVRYLYTVLVAPDKSWKIAISFDQLFNAASNGNEDETVSSRAGRAKRENKKWGCVLCKLLDVFDKNHCDKSVGT
jgi:hypothetical protein